MRILCLNCGGLTPQSGTIEERGHSQALCVIIAGFAVDRYGCGDQRRVDGS